MRGMDGQLTTIERNFLESWGELLKLSEEERNHIYRLLTRRSVEPQTVIARQGEQNGELFLIHQGSIKVTYVQGDREFFITTLNTGDIAWENFFNVSLWTVNLTALTKSKLYVLSRENLARLEEQVPGLKNKLEDHYRSRTDIQAMLRKKKLNRRQYERYMIRRKVQLQLTDTKGRPLGRDFRGELIDISTGGLAFFIRILKAKHRQMLLNRDMQITIPVGNRAASLHVHGRITGINPAERKPDAFSIHLQFKELLKSPTLQMVLG